MKTTTLAPLLFLILVIGLTSFSLFRIRTSNNALAAAFPARGIISSPADPGNKDDAVYYTCGQCGCAEDDSFFVKPGTCGGCGMQLIATYKGIKKSEPQELVTAKKSVAVLVFDGVQTIDYSGPVEVFSQAGMKIFTVAEKMTPLKTAAGLKILPDYTLADCPQADIIVLPGGNVNKTRQSPEVQAWVKKNAATSEQVLSVCNGAFYLASAGLLDHEKATTFNGLIDELQSEVPTANIVRDERFVDNGKIITTAGLASGIDGALHVVEKYVGTGKAQEMATNLEYNWDPKGDYVRAALADNQLCNGMSVAEQFSHETLAYWGNRDQWQVKYLVKSDLTQAQLLNLFDAQFRETNHWTNTSKNADRYEWKYKSEDGRQWLAYTQVDGKAGEWNVSLEVKAM